MKRVSSESIDPRHLLVNVADVLSKFGIPYFVTGGMAVFVWGRPRFTADIDMAIRLRREDIDPLAEALRALSGGSYIDTNVMQDALLRRGEFNFIDGRTGMKVDFWILGDGLYENAQLQRRRKRTILHRQVYFCSPEDLILSKLLWYKKSESSRQHEDIESILHMQKKLNRTYLKEWTKEHSTLPMLKNLWRKHRQDAL